MSKEAILGIIYEQIDEVNEMMDADEQLAKAETTILFGDGSNLDSLGFVNLMVGIEDEVNEQFDTELSLTDEELLDDENSPLQTVNTLTQYILGQLN